MGSRLYVGNIPFTTTEADLRTFFSEGGRNVTDVKIMTDRETGRSRGFGFVTMSSDQEAQDVARALNGQNMGGRPIRVNEAEDRPGGFGGGGGGGRGPGGGGGFRGGDRGGDRGGFRGGSRGARWGCVGGAPGPGGATGRARRARRAGPPGPARARFRIEPRA